MSLMKRKSSKETNAPIAPSIIKNYTPETPINFFDKEKFTFEKCVFDGLFINNKEDIYQAKCGHFYHKNCYNKLIEDIKKTGNKKELKNKSMKKHINMQKFLTESSICMLDLNSLNENEAKKKYQTINAVKSISISNNQFFNMKNEFKRNNYK